MASKTNKNLVFTEFLTCDICGKEGTFNNPVRRYILYRRGIMGTPEGVRDLCDECIDEAKEVKP